MANRVNENFFHNCESDKQPIHEHEKAITEMDYEQEQIIRILDFFLFHPPVIKDEKEKRHFGQKTLREYGWVGTSQLSRLEGKLLKAAGMGAFCFIKADTIENTLKEMDLLDRACVEHPRAVLRQNISVSIYEDGSTNIVQKETRMVCLFRHIRNSLAHNQTYLFDNGNILLEDTDDNGKISARILLPKEALIEWISIVSSGIDGNSELHQER